MRKIALCLAALCVITTGAAEAKDAPHQKPSICERAYNARVKVVHRHGSRAPGRNICRRGVKVKNHTRGVNAQRGFTIRPATVKEKWNYLVQLRVLARPAPPYLARVAVLPSRPPAGVLSSAYSATGTAACIIYAESKGNPNASNGTHFGIAQWSYSTWAAHGGKRMTGHSDPRDATYQQQLMVLSHALATVGVGDWKPYDGCG